LNFEVRDDEPWPVTLIQMPNGTGKTTTLNLLRGTLSGDFEDRAKWTKEKIRQLQKKDFEDDTGRFRVDLLVAERRLTLIVEFDFGEGAARYKTSYGSGQKNGFNPPGVVQRFFRSGFVNFFAFDGELAEQLLSHDHTDADRAIEDLFQLSIFDGITTAIDDYWDSQTSGRTATKQKGYSQRKKRVQWLRERLEELMQKKEENVREKDEVEIKLKAVRDKFDERISASQKKAAYLQEKERGFQQSKGLVASLSKDLLSKMRLPVALSPSFAGKVINFKNNLDRVKLPESAAKEFFEELVAEELCVCGREMDDASRQAVKERAGRYLGSDEVSLLNALKSDVDQYVGNDPSHLHEGIASNIQELVDETKKRQQRKNELEVATLAVSKDDPVLGKATEQIRELEGQLIGVEDDIRKYEDPDDRYKDENTFGIPIIERRLNDAERKLAEITHTIELKEKRDILHGIVASAHEVARGKLIQDVVADSNSRISELMPHNDIRIRSIQHCLNLEGQEGGSVGETLCVAYAFLSTLFAKTRHELPFVVDSPAGAIDLRVREQVAELVPKLSGQFVAFVISTEREGFLDSLERSVDSNVQYITLFRSTVENAGISLDKSDQLIESNDGKTVIGRHFFRGFHVDTEE
jgi:energy-coupling factor transporter ATP-binding protein EcfA2